MTVSEVASFPVAPLPPDAVAAAARPFGASRMLPAAAYSSEAVFRWEQRHLFAAGWYCLGRRDELMPDGSTQRGIRVGDVPVLLTQPAGAADEPGIDSVHAFADTCRHRGHELMGDGGCAAGAAITCPYHAWSYRLDGSLIAAPGFRESEQFVRAEHSLVELPLQMWQGWVFINATGDAPPLSTWLGDLDTLVGPYAPGELIRAETHRYTLAANWKIITENYHECYHCPQIHPELCEVTPPNSGDNYHMAGAWVGGSMTLRDEAVTMSLTGRSDGVPLPGAPPRDVLYLGLLPNLLISLHPDYVMAHRFEPTGPASTEVECSWLFSTESVASEGFSPSYAVDFWDLTNRQDWNACESVQRGVSSPHYRPGPLAPAEDAVHDFVSRIARAYTGSPLHEN
ncbi:MAG TPA: aromatic ring-hydroxylating dioxygenase subunit alpha [Mycobacteriales bacterium]|nr:aromatic ring-hydroxylating dioxygenase subunit alpha [Mycobacteriales bacterium]